MTNFEDSYANSTNTPAAGSWSIKIGYSYPNQSTENIATIFYLPNGSVDMTLTDRDEFETVNMLLQDTIASVLPADIWELINWMFVAQYWTLLYSVGQTQPTTYERDYSLFPTASSFSNPISYPNNYNIFVNETLFEIYYSYMATIVLPLLGYGQTYSGPIVFSGVLEPLSVQLMAGYTCTQLEPRPWLTIVILFIMAEYATIKGAYELVTLVVGMVQDWRRPVDGILRCWFRLTVETAINTLLRKHTNEWEEDV